MTTRPTPHLPLPAALALGLLAGLTLAGCDINSPEMPSFDTSFVLPLGTERLDIMDAVDDEDFLQVAGDGSLGFTMTGDPDTLALDFDLSAAIPAQTVDQGVGNFSLPAPAPLSFDFSLGDIWAAAAAANGMSVPVPAFPISVASAGQDLPDLVSATLSEGFLTVTITNGLPVPVGANSGVNRIVLQLVDPDGGAVVTSVSFPLLAAGQSSTQLANLAGATLPDQLAVNLSGGSAGSAGQPVTVDITDAIAIDAAFTDLVVSSATAVVENQTFDTSFNTPLPADYEITRAVIASGSVAVDLVNGMPVPCTVYLSWDQVRSLDNLPLTRTVPLAAGASATTNLDFAGYIVQTSGQPLTSLDANVHIVTPGSAGLPVTLRATDGLTAALGAGSISFSSVTGVVPAYTVPLDPITESIDLPDEMDGLELTAATLTLTLVNSAGIPADLDLTLTGTAANGSVRSLAVNDQVLPAIDRAATTTTIVLDQGNSTILDFLNNLPETISLAGDVIAGGNGATGTVRTGDFAAISWEISAPVEVVITGASLESDPNALDLDLDLRDRISTHARGAVLRTEILNHLPMAVQLRVVAAQDTTQFDTNPLLTIGPITVAAALTNPTTHVVSQAVTSTPVITLTEAQARLFGLPGLYTRIEAILPSTDGQPVRVMASDYLEFQGVVELEVLIDDQL